jgi:methionyl-tRNA formyltransferase
MHKTLAQSVAIQHIGTDGRDHPGHRRKQNFIKHRIVFMGTPEFAVPTLHALVAAGHHVAACYTRPPRPRGRGRRESPTPVHAAADAMGIPVLIPERLGDALERDRLWALAPDVVVIAAYGVILPQAIIDVAPMGCLNVHASLLPRWRGAAPVQRAILAGDERIGVTIMRIDAGMDTGPMLHAREVDAVGLTAGELTHVMAEAGARMMLEVLDDPDAYPPVTQPGRGATHAPKMTKDEARIDFSLGAAEVERAVRAYNPAPGAWTTLRGERLVIHRCEICGSGGGREYAPGNIMDGTMAIACGDGAIRPTVVQRPGRRAVDVRDMLHAMGDPTGESCG